MSKLTNQWIDGFRAGNYGKGKFTAADLDHIVSTYKPEEHEAPLTIGHPKNNLPAYGWVEAVRRVGDLLQFKAKEVDPAFEEMVEAGKFKKRSASFYIDKETGRYRLRHIGFLGAMPPEVKGLKAIQFEEGAETIEVDFEEESMPEDAGLIDRIIARIEERFGKKPGEGAVTFSEEQVRKIASDAAAAAAAEAVKPFQAKLDAHEVQFAENNASAATLATRTRAADAVLKLKNAGRWVPAFDVQGLPVVFEELARTTDTVDFGEGDKKKKVHPLDLLVEFMETTLPAIVPTKAVYTGQNSAARPAKGINPGRGGVDENSVRLDQMAVSFAEEHKVDYIVAVNKVIEQHPELATLGGASIGAV